MIRGAIVLGVVVLIASAVDKTLWDWLELLIVPAVIAAGGLWFNRQQQNREREIADHRAQDEALQAYLDQIGRLLLDKDNPLRQSKEDHDVRILARARTLAALQTLDGDRKRSLVLFLNEADLIKPPKAGELPIVQLEGTDIRGLVLKEVDNLSQVKLRDTKLSGAALSGAMLAGADLSGGTDLSNANLSGAYLGYANLRWQMMTSKANPQNR